LFNLAFALSLAKLHEPNHAVIHVASILFMAGAMTMPVVCYLSAWRKTWRHLFAVPVGCLVTAVSIIVVGLLFRGVPA